MRGHLLGVTEVTEVGGGGVPYPILRGLACPWAALGQAARDWRLQGPRSLGTVEAEPCSPIRAGRAEEAAGLGADGSPTGRR